MNSKINLDKHLQPFGPKLSPEDVRHLKKVCDARVELDDIKDDIKTKKRKSNG